MNRNVLILLLVQAALALASAAVGVQAASRQYPTAPMLRVESGSHLGSISSMTTDAASRYLVTGGNDKTVRVWSLPNFEPLETLRPPIGEGNEGRIDAVAMSPDASRIAAGGNTCKSFEGSYCVYIFDAASTRIVKRITGLASRITALEWSPDGTTLAVGMAGRSGVKLLRTGGWTEIGRDADYRGVVTTIHFDGRGRFATGSLDGNVRLYSYDLQTLTLRAKKPAADIRLPGVAAHQSRHTGLPRAVRFSPDGSKLAVGQATGAHWLAVLSSDTLETLYVPTTGNTLSGRGIHVIAWSADGSTLYAGTGKVGPAQNLVRKWSDGGRGSYTDLPAGEATVNALVADKAGGISFATGDQILGRYDAGGNKVAWMEPQEGQFHGGTDVFKVSHDGSSIEFPYETNGRSLLHFDLRSRRLGNGPIAGTTMKAPETAAGKLIFYNLWRDGRGTLQVENKSLVFGRYEISRSLAIAPDRESFVLGTRFALRHYDKSGNNLWNVPTTYNVYAVNLSGDGKLVVAALGDGTIRWYRRTDGHLLATLFVAPDRRSWVLASPTGFYDASVGGEDFLGWHVNRGRDETADFFPASRLRSRFYKPDFISEIFARADDARAFKLAAAATGASALLVVSSALDTETDAPEQTPAPVAPVTAPPPAAPAAKPGKPTQAPPIPAPAPVATAQAKPIQSTTLAAPAIEPAVPAAQATTAPDPAAPTPPPPAASAAIPAAPSATAASESTLEVQAVENAVVQQVTDLSSVLPPVVTVHSPANGSTVSGTQITLRYSVKTAKDAPVIGVRTRIDGLAATSRNLVIAATDSSIMELTVTIPQQDTEILVFAENKNGVSAPDRVRLTWMGTPKSVTPIAKPTLYVLAIGVSRYTKPEYRLDFAAKDATDFVNILQQQKGRLYGDVVVKLLTDDKASNTEVIAGFEWLQKQVTPKDVGMVFIAGHGLNDDKSGYYYLPVNADLEKLEATGVPFDQIKVHLANLSGKALLFVDTCHSGNVMGGGRKGGRSNDVNGMLNELSSAEYGLVVLASSTGRQFSMENPDWGNGAFTKALVEGLSGRADLKKRGRITHKMLDFYVSDRVDELTGGQQTPVNSSPQGVPDYTVAVAPN